jgi:hypothetical protein
MPLFNGLSIVIGNTVNPSRLTLVYWSMMGYFFTAAGGPSNNQLGGQ